MVHHITIRLSKVKWTKNHMQFFSQVTGCELDIHSSVSWRGMVLPFANISSEVEPTKSSVQQVVWDSFRRTYQYEHKSEHVHAIPRLSMCGAFPPHCIFLVWCPESHSSVLGHYIALAIILWKRWSNLLSLFMELTCLFSTLILSTSDIIFKKHVRHEIWLSCHFIIFPPPTIFLDMLDGLTVWT